MLMGMFPWWQVGHGVAIKGVAAGGVVGDLPTGEDRGEGVVNRSEEAGAGLISGGFQWGHIGGGGAEVGFSVARIYRLAGYGTDCDRSTVSPRPLAGAKPVGLD